MNFGVKTFNLLIITLLLFFGAHAQVESPLRVGHCVASSTPIRIDSLSVIPESFQLHNATPTQYSLDPISATLYVRDSTLWGQTLTFSYRTFSFNFSQPRGHRSLELIEQPRSDWQPAVNALSTVADLRDNGQLLTSGSISRGISVGNAQDVVLNSSLNLQLSGKLSDDVTIQAVISDKNIPIQPEGNTQSVYDINNIFITIKIKDFLQLDAGDVELFSPEADFLRLSRNLLGMKAQLKAPISEKFKMVNSLGGGIAKGKFVRQNVTPINGVQGPYKLTGEDGELNIVIIAASERVYVEGVLMTRGQENDYTINYNTGELTFTPKMLVMDDKRIVVEFEYTDKHYSRYNLFSYNDLEVGKKLKLHVNYYHEQDLKGQSIQPELDDKQKLFLSTMGDKIDSCYYECADSIPYSPDRILYCKMDTLVDGVLYQDVYRYTTSDSIQLYALSFTYMGYHKGSYQLLNSTTNGRVFGWVAPVEGEKQGDYEPVLLLATPKLMQMATISADYEFRPSSKIRTELALSNYDQNTFSKKNDGDNVGFAYFLDVYHDQILKTKSQDTSDWRLNSQLQWQFVHRNFHVVESFRSVEFATDFNLNEDYSNSYSEQMLKAVLGVVKADICRSQYTLDWFSRLGLLQAVRQELTSNNHFGIFQFNTKTSLLLSHDSLWNSRFWTSENMLKLNFKKWQVGVSDKVEHNLFKRSEGDSLRADSYAYNEAILFVKNSDSSAVSYGLSYKNRMDYTAASASLQLQRIAHEIGANLQSDKIRNQHFAFNAIYRNQSLHDENGRISPEHYFVGNLEYTGRFCRNAILLSTYYEMGSGMEQKRTFSFIRVADGQGTHTWIDYNDNGIEEIGEFELAAFQDQANYVKVWLTGTEYVNTYNNQFSQSLQLRPAAVWMNKTGFRRFLARFQNVAMFRSQLKHAYPNFNPFYSRMEDTNLVSRSLSFNNTFSFNNSASKFAFDFVAQENQTKSLLYYGYEQNAVSLQQLVLKSAVASFLRLQGGFLHRITNNQSQYMLERTYQIVQYQGDGSVQWNVGDKYTGNVTYLYANRHSQLTADRVGEHRLSLTFSYRMVRRGVLTATAQYVQLNGDVENGTPLAYTMLEGLSVGRNAIWNLGCQIAIADYLQLSLQYDGRASQEHKVVHTGNCTIKAQF